MTQLIMNWKDDGSEKIMPKLPENVELLNFSEVDNAIDVWLDIIKYLDRDGKLKADKEYFIKNMSDHPNFEERLCFFLVVNGMPAATLTVICDSLIKVGYIHMVACKPGFRGRGLGNLLNDIALYTLKSEGMQTAYLTTDDWRIPAIKSYLRAGFVPNLTDSPDFHGRWQKIYEKL